MRLVLPQPVNFIIEKVKSANLEIYVVGGAVRDLLMKKSVTDWDFTTNATPSQILEIFPEGFYDNIFGTVGINLETEKKPYEITTFRTEHGYSDQRRPDSVSWGKTLEEDLSRRDFTINAMALKPTEKGNFELIDIFAGQKDLDSKVIRTVGDASERFSEDTLRIMRAIRIASQLGFTIENKTFIAVVRNVSKILNISFERIRDELFKILTSDHAYDGLILLKNSGVMELILPEVYRGFGVEQESPGRHHIYDVGTHSLLSAKFCPSDDPLVKFATLLHDCGKPLTYKILQNGTITFYNHEVKGAQIAYETGNRFKLSKTQLKRLVTLVRWHQFSVDERQTDSAIRRFIRRVGKENLNDMLALRTGDRLGGGARETSWRLEKYKKRITGLLVTPFTISDMAVDGHDVMEILDLKPGPRVGKILNHLFTLVMEDHTKNDHDYLMSLVKSGKVPKTEP